MQLQVKMFESIHKKLIFRLSLAWCCLSVLIGATVYFIEHEKIDNFVVGLATEKSKEFLSEEIDCINSPIPANIEALRQRSMENLLKGNFIIVEFYNKNKKPVIEIAKPEMELVEKVLNEKKHGLLMTDTTQYEKIHINEQLFVRVISPIKKEGDAIAGYFEGIYEVEARVMSDINSRVLFSLLQVIIALLIASVVLYPVIISLNKSLLKYSLDLSNANIGMLEVLGNAIAKRDSDTNDHNYRVTIYSIRLAEAIGLSKTKIEELVKGAFLHDVGKIGISDNILLKPGKLTNEEFEIMKTHVAHGEEIIRDYAWLKDAVNVVSNHHEKYAGTGYLNGLKGEEIPVTARLFAIIDVFDALTSKRPYKKAFSFEESMRILNEGRGEHFDPVLLDEFKKIAEGLYEELHGADEASLKKSLRLLIDKHF